VDETEAVVENCLRALSRFKPGEKLCDVLGNLGTGQDQGKGFKREKVGKADIIIYKN
jgi:hypothetical protein